MDLTRRSLLLAGVGLAAATAGCNGTAVKQAEQSQSAQAGQSASAGASASVGALTVGLTYIPNIQFAPFYWAADKGLFAQQGVAATLRHHGASEGLFNALTAGTEHLVIAGGDEVVQARSQGMDLVTVAAYYQKYPLVLIVPKDSTITSLAGLKGKRVGVPGRYGESWYALQLALKNGGLTESDVKVTEIGYTQQAALATRKVDAIVGFSNNDVVQFAQSGIAVRTLDLGTDVPLVSSSLVTTTALLAQRRAAVQAACRAIVDGMKAVVASPDEAITVSAAHVPGLTAAAAQKSARATLDATLPLWRGDGTIDGKLSQDTFVKMAGFMKQAGLLTKDVDGAAAVDTTVMG